MDAEDNFPVVDPSRLPNNERTRALLKEAFSLVSEIADMDKQFDAEVRKLHGDFAIALEEYFSQSPTADFAADTARNEAIKGSLNVVFRGLAKLLKLSAKEIPFVGEAVDVFTSDKQPSFRAAYMDGMSNQRRAAYSAKKRRLATIMRDLSTMQTVPTWTDLKNVCAHERCWQTYKPR